jgi:hypothetical protein
MANGYRFPSTAQTASQAKDLGRIVQNYLRIFIARQLHEFSVETVGEALGLGERQAKTVIKNACELPWSAQVELTMDVLQGMVERRIAGVLGTPKTLDNRKVFRVVYETDYFTRLSEAPRGLPGPDSGQQMLMLHAAFCIHYHEWIRRS